MTDCNVSGFCRFSHCVSALCDHSGPEATSSTGAINITRNKPEIHPQNCKQSFNYSKAASEAGFWPSSAHWPTDLGVVQLVAHFGCDGQRKTIILNYPALNFISNSAIINSDYGVVKA